MNERQFKYRVKHRLCWPCNSPLFQSAMFYGWTCCHCGRRYAENVLRAHERAKAAIERQEGKR